MKAALPVLPVLFITLVVISASSQDSSQNASQTRESALQFEVTEYDFGDVRQGQIVEHEFPFKVGGDRPLLITNVIATCGCTAPEWPRAPLSPGEKGKILIRFNSAGRLGRQHKIIAVRSDTGAPDQRLRISAMVLPPGK